MGLSDFASEITATDNFVKASFGGFAGSGKTLTACKFIVGAYRQLNLQAPLLMIDNERGSKFLVDFFRNTGIKTLLKETNNLADIQSAFNFLSSGEIGFLFIDSMTKIWYEYVRQYKEKNKKDSMTVKDWGNVIPAWQENFLNKFFEAKGHCVFTGRGGFSYSFQESDEKAEDGSTLKESIADGVKMKLGGDAPFEPDLNVWMSAQQKLIGKTPHLWIEAFILKDRSRSINGQTFKNPEYSNFQPFIDYLCGIQTGDVKTQSEKNIAPSITPENAQKTISYTEEIHQTILKELSNCKSRKEVVALSNKYIQYNSVDKFRKIIRDKANELN